MLILLIALGLGFLFAKKDLLSPIITKRMGILSTFALILLLFSMGLSMGSNKEIIASLPQLGGKAFLLSICTILSSILFVYAAKVLTAKKSKKGEQKYDSYHLS